MERVDRRYERGEVTMAFTDVRGTGPHTFVMVHGIGMGRIVFAEVDEILSGAGRVLAVDLPGFGDSPEPGSAASLEETAEVIARFIRDEVRGSDEVRGADEVRGTDEVYDTDEQGSEGQRSVVLVGHSMGTQIVAEIACRYPELVRALVLIAPTVNQHERTALKQAMRMVQDLTGEGPKVLFLGLWEYAKTSPVWFVKKLRFMLNHSLESICAEIKAPTLVLRGETDRVCPRRWVSEVTRAIPDSDMAEIPGRGHEAVIKSPEPVASMILDFLRDRGLLSRGPASDNAPKRVH